MSKINFATKFVLVATILNAIIIINKDNLVQGIFFLDLLCATRIESLEKQVAQLVALNQAALTTTTTTTARTTVLRSSRSIKDQGLSSENFENSTSIKHPESDGTVRNPRSVANPSLSKTDRLIISKNIRSFAKSTNNSNALRRQSKDNQFLD